MIRDVVCEVYLKSGGEDRGGRDHVAPPNPGDFDVWRLNMKMFNIELSGGTARSFDIEMLDIKTWRHWRLANARSFDVKAFNIEQSYGKKTERLYIDLWIDRDMGQEDYI